MDLDQAHGVLTNRSKQGPPRNNSHTEYRRKLENLTLDPEGRQFQMLVFRGSPKSSRRPTHLIDEMRRSDEENPIRKPLRGFPKRESRILDAPNLKRDFYLETIDWGKSNVLAVALGAEVYLWNEDGRGIEVLSEVDGTDYPASVSWYEEASVVAVGYNCNRLHLYDAESLKLGRSLDCHKGRVGSLAWNGYLLTTGSKDRAIISHDVRARNSVVCYVKAHKMEVCGLKWSNTGKILASGGNDNVVYLWDVRKMGARQHLYRFNDHSGAVKALAWCPYDDNMLASGGGTSDGSIKMWNTQKGTCISSTKTNAQASFGDYANCGISVCYYEQVCGLEWNIHHKEILSGHGYGFEPGNNRLCLWRYPSMSKIGESGVHTSRILHLSQSPDGLTVASAVADETLRLWEVFGPKSNNEKITYLEGLLSFKTTPLR
ncbi:cell division cycle [Striga asiatica]|uniref:Cell division cycle n=1 Tax=Striga asiatica TaxID=4170 RepID=A0A5A7QNR4_STRAF|nr:cell division cycle [Striga asiatica]